MFEPLFTPLFSSLLSPLIAAAQRIFIKLDPVLESQYTIQNPVVETGDFEFSVDSSTTSATTQAILGKAGAGFGYLRINSDGNIQMLIDDATTASTGLSLADGILHKDILKRVGGMSTVLIDAAAVANINSVAEDFTIGSIGSYNSGNFFNGIIANVDLGGGNAWKLDKATSNTEQAANGNNLLTYVNIPESNKELFQFNAAANQWENISPQPQNLPAIIEVA